MFENESVPAEEFLARRRMAGILIVAGIVLAVAIAILYFLSRSSPYAEEIRLLHQGMARIDVETALGYPKNGPMTMGDVEGTGYAINGERFPLMIRYDQRDSDLPSPSDKALDWCGLFPVGKGTPGPEGSQEYEVKCHDLPKF